ncbi:MAG: hypothetical protein GTO55_05440 [Armatimonadetes bacterium]|nr:hypothetical protein [Armatimonadota bacterium]NIM23701.1 hypothetical protein [Armatimonadota bacterium]NIM67578.1 hypothetical protein [Armatimonadota bacterium]NIM76101.1 hypothetical protein [Armatimonadota bacterium]NIN05784.1 hypothetical protein [Armatimonadota bacterium]
MLVLVLPLPVCVLVGALTWGRGLPISVLTHVVICQNLIPHLTASLWSAVAVLFSVLLIFGVLSIPWGRHLKRTEGDFHWLRASVAAVAVFLSPPGMFALGALSDGFTAARGEEFSQLFHRFLYFMTTQEPWYMTIVVANSALAFVLVGLPWRHLANTTPME